MKATSNPISADNGFTLLEVVVALTVISIVGVFLIQLAGTAIEQSSTPLAAMHTGLGLAQVMEKMTADYAWVLLTDATPLETFKNRAENGNNPTNDPFFGDYQVAAKYVEFDPSGTDFQEAAAACTEACTILKVTISYGNQHLTALFTN